MKYTIRLPVHCMFHTFFSMGQEAQSPPRSGQDYAALRQIGTPAGRAMTELGLGVRLARRMEASFRARTHRGGGDLQLPKFARHEEHVAAVLAEGGFCAFSERRVGRYGAVVCLPLVWP
jgi:hypothetical protein